MSACSSPFIAEELLGIELAFVFDNWLISFLLTAMRAFLAPDPSNTCCANARLKLVNALLVCDIQCDH